MPLGNKRIVPAIATQTETLFKTYRKDLGLPSDSAERMFALLPAAWWMWAVHFDPLPALKTYQGPVLEMFGGKDLQVSATVNAPLMETMLVHESSEAMVFNKLNHLFQPAKTGSPEEYPWTSITFDPDAMKALVDWMDSRLH